MKDRGREAADLYQTGGNEQKVGRYGQEDDSYGHEAPQLRPGVPWEARQAPGQTRAGHGRQDITS